MTDKLIEALKECELFLRVLGQDSEAAAKVAQSARDALAAHSSQQEAAHEPVWRVGEFWSSSSPREKVLCLQVGAIEIAEGARHHSFIRWVNTSTAPSESAAKDTERLDYVLSAGAFISWSLRDGSIRQCQVMVQNEDEEYEYPAGEHRFFNTERDAIDAALSASGQKGGSRDDS